MSFNKNTSIGIINYIIFAGIMLAVFHLTFNSVGKYLSDILAHVITMASGKLEHIMAGLDINPAFRALVTEGICPGVGSVLSFIPIIAVLFFLLSILEESGYLSKAAIIMDRPLGLLGLSGQCIVPLIMGFGCAVPAVIYTDSLPSESHKRTVIRLIPFMSCSARLPVYAMFISVFFIQYRILMLFCIYAVGILLSLLTAWFFKEKKRRTFSSCHALPTDGTVCGRQGGSAGRTVCWCHGGSAGRTVCWCHGRSAGKTALIAAASRVFRTVWDNVFGFIKKAFTVIFTASVLIWFLRSYDFSLQPISCVSESILAQLGELAAPFFAPLGFGDWRAASAVIAGLTAKEAIISTLAVTASSGNGPLSTMLTEVFTPLSAFSFLVFCLLYMPCVATLSAVRNITGSWRESIIMAVSHILVAWIVAFLIYNVGTFFSGLI